MGAVAVAGRADMVTVGKLVAGSVVEVARGTAVAVGPGAGFVRRQPASNVAMTTRLASPTYRPAGRPALVATSLWAADSRRLIQAGTDQHFQPLARAGDLKRLCNVSQVEPM